MRRCAWAVPYVRILEIYAVVPPVHIYSWCGVHRLPGPLDTLLCVFIWNKIPFNILSLKNRNTFRHAVKCYFFGAM